MTNDEVNYVYKVADITATYSPSLRQYGREDFRQTCALAAVIHYHRVPAFDSFKSFAKSIVWFTAKDIKRKNWNQAMREGPMNEDEAESIEDLRAGERIDEIQNEYDRELLLTKAMPKLSETDLEIVDRIYNGERITDISHKIGISYQAVQQRVKTIFKKLQEA
jgi:RNA polymerase sigma factor (sigma-70 family)